jgi:hypothetical protein
MPCVTRGGASCCWSIGDGKFSMHTSACSGGCYQVKLSAAVGGSLPVKFLGAQRDAYSSRNDFDHRTENPACASPTRFFFETLGLVRNELPPRKMLRPTTRPCVPAKK